MLDFDNGMKFELAGDYTPETVPSDLVAESGRHINRTPQNLERMTAVAEFWADLRDGRVDPIFAMEALHPTPGRDFIHSEMRSRYPFLFASEAMTVSDFSILSDNLMERMLMEDYRAYTPTYSRIAKVRSGIKDFRSLKSYGRSGGRDTWGENKELEGFERGKLIQSSRTWSIKKYRRGFQHSWEAVIGDDLGFFNDLPNRLAAGAAFTVEDVVTKLYAGATGFNTAAFTSGFGNIISATISGSTVTNPLLSLEALQGAIEMLLNRTDPDDATPIVGNTQLTLVVGSGALLTKAQNIKNQLITEYNTLNGSNAITQTDQVRNWVANMFEVVFNPWIAKVATTGSAYQKTWFLFAGNPQGGFFGRPAIELGYLRGFDAPQLFKKMPNAQRVGGGLDQSIGDFETMAHEYMGVHVFGAHVVDELAMLASNGSLS